MNALVSAADEITARTSESLSEILNTHPQVGGVDERLNTHP